MNFLNLKFDFMEMYSLGYTWKYVIIGSDNGLAPNSCQYSETCL